MSRRRPWKQDLPRAAVKDGKGLVRWLTHVARNNIRDVVGRRRLELVESWSQAVSAETPSRLGAGADRSRPRRTARPARRPSARHRTALPRGAFAGRNRAPCAAVAGRSQQTVRARLDPARAPAGLRSQLTRWHTARPRKCSTGRRAETGRDVRLRQREKSLVARPDSPPLLTSRCESRRRRSPSREPKGRDRQRDRQEHGFERQLVVNRRRRPTPGTPTP